MNPSVILVTGALTGIGRATALAFAKSGARIVVSGRRVAEGKALVAELERLDAQAQFIQADVRQDNEVRELIDQTVAHFGRLDVAVNCAGTEGQPGLVVDQTAESYAATFDTNVLGTLLSMKHELRVMTAQKSGSIINISSTYGHEGAAYASVYAGSISMRRRFHPVGSVGSRRLGCARQRSGAGTDRHGHAGSLHWHAGEQSRIGRRCSAGAPGQAG